MGKWLPFDSRQACDPLAEWQDDDSGRLVRGARNLVERWGEDCIGFGSIRCRRDPTTRCPCAQAMDDDRAVRWLDGTTAGLGSRAVVREGLPPSGRSVPAKGNPTSGRTLSEMFTHPLTQPPAPPARSLYLCIFPQAAQDHRRTCNSIGFR